MCVHKHTHARGDLGVSPQEKFCKLDALRLLLRPLLAQAALQLLLLSVRLHMYDSNSYRHPHAMQWPLLKSPNFRVSSSEYIYTGLLNLGLGHNVATLDTCALASLQWHGARLTSWPRQWLLSSCSGVNL